MKCNPKPCITTKKVIHRGKRGKSLREVKLVKNISKNPQSFLEISLVLKEEEKLPESIEPSKFVSHSARMSREFDSRKDPHSAKFKLRPQIFVKLSFRELCGPKLACLHTFDNMAIIH